ncbi:MAG: dihydrofolate reductase family protein [Anaerolineaceae bacterium]|nr:dihydrofolate reductase family protein [Anaerolineaceae bacterium]
MRKLVVTEFLTLDGVMENPAWSMPYWCDEIAAFKGAEQTACDAFLLGRVTYEAFASVWPHRSNGDDPGAEAMNGYPKYVASRTLKEVRWNNSHLITGDTTTSIQKLKELPGKDILVYGSGKLVNFLTEAGLVDQFNLLTYPMILGQGQRLFNAAPTVKLELVEGKTTPTGVVSQIYKVIK